MNISPNTQFFSALVLVVFLSANVLAVETVSFSGGAPLNSYNPHMVIPILTEAFKRNGITFSASYRPSLRSLKLTNSGIYDGELHRVFDFYNVSEGKYPNLIRVESQLLSVWMAAFSTEPRNIESWDDLRGLKVAYYRGRQNITNVLDKVLAAESIIRVSTDEQAFKLLASKRVDIVVTTSTQGKDIIAGTPALADIFEVAKLDETKIFAYMHKKHRLLANKIAATIEQMKTEGAFDRIFNQSQKQWEQRQ